jgi:hypothetical protein
MFICARLEIKLFVARELQGDHPETADVKSEPSVFIRILLGLELRF